MLSKAQTDMNDWIEWRGGKFDAEPVSGLIEVKFRGGDTDQDFADMYYWAHDGDDSDIVAYRIVESSDEG